MLSNMKINTFFTFVNEQCGNLREALNFYTTLFPNSEIKRIEMYGDDEIGGAPELVKHALFTINGKEYMASENNLEHDFGCTPAVSLFVECDSQEQMNTFFKELSNGGQVMMPPDDYGFSKQFAWCSDIYGISWQLNLS